MKNPAGLKAWLVVLALFVLPYFLLLSYFSYFGKDVVYLRDGGPPWILNPEDSPLANGFPNDFPAVYAFGFELDAPPVSGYIEVNAVKAYVLSINGTQLTSEEETAKQNWKFSSRRDITPYLRQDENFISIYVHSPYSITALKVRGEAQDASGERVSLDSGNTWAVASEKSFPPLGIVGKTWNQVEVLTHESFMDKLRSGRYWWGSLFLFAYSGLIIAAVFLIPGVFKGLDRALLNLVPGPFRTEKGKKTLYAVSCTAIFLVLGLTLINNFLKYPAERTGDYQFHLEYLNHFLGSWRFPLANEGFEMYNPPAFYLLSAILYKIFGSGGVMTGVTRYAQLLNTASTILTVFLLFLIVRRVTGERGSTLLALALAAFLPISLYKAPAVSGDGLFTLVCAVIFYIWLGYLERPARVPALAAGLLTGLAFMTRFTALFVLIGILCGFFYLLVRGTEKRKARVIDLALFSGGLLAVAGWYYARNLVHFHNLFPINGTPEISFFRQVPGYRDWDFYTNISALFIDNPFSKGNVTESFFAGTYSTFWFDGQRLMTATWNPVLVFAALALSLFPAALMVYGAAKAAGTAISGSLEGRAIFLGSSLVTLSLSLVGFAIGTYRFPSLYFLKAHYIMFCIVPLLCLFGLGVKALTARSGWSLVSLWTLAVCSLNLAMFYL